MQLYYKLYIYYSHVVFMHAAGVLISGPVDCLYVYIQPGVFGEHGQCPAVYIFTYIIGNSF